ncbi:MAG: hypothetical protein NPMRTH4_240001 [Nitrosopumilales archaeon]|nr:MAG: hypothetical protein NPMRTH4_240001 [Nitrosopumilales archaeon]
MEHTFFFDGNAKRISWVIQNKDSQMNQFREHAEMYLDKVNQEQSKYVALHVGLFWGIGTFTIKNNDTIKIMIDSKSMYENLANNLGTYDQFINIKKNYIKKLIEQRKLKVSYHIIDSKENSATKLI